MINWNIVPMWWSESLPYTLFTEMEWIGKLSYMCNDLNTRLTTAEAAISDFDTRLQAAEYQININKSDIISLSGRMDTAEGNITGIDTRLGLAEGTLDNVSNTVTVLNAFDKILLTAPTIPAPVDDNNVRTYTIPLEDIVTNYYKIKLNVNYTTVTTQPGTVITAGGDIEIIIPPGTSTKTKSINLYKIYSDNYTNPPTAVSFAVLNTITFTISGNNLIITIPAANLSYNDSTGTVILDTNDGYCSITDLFIEYVKM